MASVASQLIEEVTAHAQSDSLEDAREICADGTYLPNNLRKCRQDSSVYTVARVRAQRRRNRSSVLDRDEFFLFSDRTGLDNLKFNGYTCLVLELKRSGA